MQRGSSTLNLSDSFIGDEGCILVAQYLRENLGVHSLELRGNSITFEGLKSLASVLRSQSFVRNISLEWNNIGDGIGILTDALIYNNSIQSLDLRNNRIGPDGAGHIARFIENSSSIIKIDLRWNELGVLGAKKLLISIPRSRSLKNIELSGNKIPEDLILQIESIVKSEDKYLKSDEKYAKTEEKFYKEEKTFKDEKSGLRSPSRITKEFNYNDELYLKYETQMISNARNEARINELEILLDQETRRVSEVRNDLLKDLENEKARRAYSDESLMLFKEEALKKEMEDGRTIQELDSKLGRTINEKNMILMDLQNLQEQYEKLHNNSQERIRNLEDRINSQDRQYRQLEESTRSSLERNKKETEQALYEISREYQNKLETSEENARILKNTKENAELEIKSLKSQIIQIKSQAQEALSELEYRIKEEETNKYNNTVRNYEGRIKTLEDSRENLNKRISDLQKEFSQSEKRASEQNNSLESSINSLREEKADQAGRIQKLTIQKESLQNEIFVVKSALDRANQDNEELNNALKERKETHIIQLEKICQEHTGERKTFESNIDALNEEIKQLELELNRSRRERERIIKEHEYLAETLKQRVSSLIQDTVLGHMRKLDSD